eukprot:8313674-Pyramimonas_sp.AAC.1
MLSVSILMYRAMGCAVLRPGLRCDDRKNATQRRREHCHKSWPQMFYVASATGGVCISELVCATTAHVSCT